MILSHHIYIYSIYIYTDMILSHKDLEIRQGLLYVCIYIYTYVYI